MIMSYYYLYNLQIKNNKTVSPTNLFIELNDLSLLIVFDYCSWQYFEFAKFKTISGFIHLIKSSKVEVIFLHFK